MEISGHAGSVLSGNQHTDFKEHCISFPSWPPLQDSFKIEDIDLQFLTVGDILDW